MIELEFNVELRSTRIQEIDVARAATRLRYVIHKYGTDRELECKIRASSKCYILREIKAFRRHYITEMRTSATKQHKHRDGPSEDAGACRVERPRHGDHARVSLSSHPGETATTRPPLQNNIIHHFITTTVLWLFALYSTLYDSLIWTTGNGASF